MTLTQLKILLTILDTGSFSRAAEVLHISQPGISHSLSSLEEELGGKLLERHNKKVIPTDLGRRIIPKMREMLHLEQQIEEEIHAWQGLHIGKIRIGCFSSVLVKWLPRLLHSFQSKYQGIEISVLEGTYDEIIEWIRIGRVDIGFLSLPCTEVEQIPLTQDEYLLVVPLAHPLGEQSHISLEEISHEPFIMPNAGCETTIRKMFADQSLSPRVLFEIRDTSTILDLVAQGTGITILPALALPTALPRVQIRELLPTITREIGFGLRSLRNISPVCRAFVDHTQAMIGKNTTAIE